MVGMCSARMVDPKRCRRRVACTITNESAAHPSKQIAVTSASKLFLAVMGAVRLSLIFFLV
jgi:hypothetical protein